MKPTFLKWTSVCLLMVLITATLGLVLLGPTSSKATISDGEGAAISKANTNLTGWQVQGEGTLWDTEEGLLLSSEPKENVMALSSVKSEDFIFEADIKVVDMHADATLVFRSNDDGWDSYMLQIVPNAGIVRLRDARDETRLKVEHPVSLQEGGIYHVRVKVIDDNIKVYWENQYAPIMDVKNSTYTTGLLGLNVWNGSALFQNVKVSELLSNLGSSLLTKGEWEPSIKGLKGSALEGGEALQLFHLRESDFQLEGNISFEHDQSEAGLVFRTNDQGTEGYEAVLVRKGNTVQAQLKKMDGTILQTSGHTYPSQEGAKHHLEVIANGSQLELYVDGYSKAAVILSDSSFGAGYTGLIVASGAASFQDVYLVPTANYYKEKYRPDYHYTPARGSASDPNGLVYYEGEYHLFHQDGGTWAHAVSNDLVNWKRLPIALPWNDQGHVWSGSAVADVNNASGLFTHSGGKGLIAYYTSFHPDRWNGNQRVGLAYSSDQGRTWHYSTEKPIVIQNPGENGEDPGGWDFRDPKVVRDEANNRWMMVVSGGDHIRFFTSTNLIDWTLTDNFGYGDYVRGGVWECPDLFELPVEGTTEKKWVLMISTGANPKTQGSDAEYFIGELTPEGKFINDNPVGKVLKTDYGKEYYASMSFANMPVNRRVMMAWMTNWDYPFAFPTDGWKGVLSVPREVRLVNTEVGIRIAQSPIQELEALRSTIFETQNKNMNSTNAPNLLKGLSSGAYEIEAEIEIPSIRQATEFGFRVREGMEEKTVIGYKTGEHQMFLDRSQSGETDFSSLFSKLHEAPLKPENNRIKMRLFVDDSSVEVFANDGKVVFSDVIFPDPSSRSMSFYTNGGEVKIISLKVHSLSNTWAKDFGENESIAIDTKPREMSKGEKLVLFASLDMGKGSTHKPLMWKSSNPRVVKITSSTNSKVTLHAERKGEAVITAYTPNGKASANVTVKVFDGQFHSNLTGWTSDISAAKWTVTEDGIRGSYTSDANYVAHESAGDFTYEADMKLGVLGGAGSILFRASDEGKSGYYFNLDPNMKAFRLFYKINGRFEDRNILAKVPAFIEPGKSYRVRIEANGPHIQITVDNKKIIELKDGTFAEGHFGVNVFGGEAFYQNVQVSQMTEAQLTVTNFTNLATGQALYTRISQDGEPVTVTEESKATHWTLVPTGDEFGSYSIRTEDGKALDFDTAQNKIQLYDYLGFHNQRWILKENENGTVTVISVHNGKVLDISEESKLILSDWQLGEQRQQWKN